MSTGTIILPTGASSAGKPTRARALQAALEDRFVHVSLDRFEEMGPRIPLTQPALERFYDECLIPVMHQCVAAFAAAGPACRSGAGPLDGVSIASLLLRAASVRLPAAARAQRRRSRRTSPLRPVLQRRTPPA